MMMEQPIQVGGGMMMDTGGMLINNVGMVLNGAAPAYAPMGMDAHHMVDGGGMMSNGYMVEPTQMMDGGMMMEAHAAVMMDGGMIAPPPGLPIIDPSMMNGSTAELLHMNGTAEMQMNG
jgi:hypothetical protein